MIFFSDIEGATQDIPYIIVGDAAFPLRTNLLRPYPERNLPNIVTNSSYSVSWLLENRAVFKYRLSHARRGIENSFGI